MDRLGLQQFDEGGMGGFGNGMPYMPDFDDLEEFLDIGFWGNGGFDAVMFQDEGVGEFGMC
jgi:hypothetical protein